MASPEPTHDEHCEGEWVTGPWGGALTVCQCADRQDARLADPTQPVPGPTREQMPQPLREVCAALDTMLDACEAMQSQIPKVWDEFDRRSAALLPARPSPTDDGQWELFRGYGVRRSDGARAWCYTADQEQSPELAQELLATLAEIERLRGSEAALRRAFDVAHEAGDQLWADRAEMEAEIERLRAHQEPA